MTRIGLRSYEFGTEHISWHSDQIAAIEAAATEIDFNLAYPTELIDETNVIIIPHFTLRQLAFETLKYRD